MSTPTRIALFTFAVDDDGENRVEIVSRGIGRRLLRVTAKAWARRQRVAFGCGTFALRRGNSYAWEVPCEHRDRILNDEVRRGAAVAVLER